MKEQVKNRSVSKTLTYQGKTMALQEWCDLYGLKYCTLYMRIRRGQNAEQALKPIK